LCYATGSFDRFNIPILFIIVFAGGLVLLLIHVMGRDVIDGKILLSLMMVPPISVGIFVLFFVFLPGRHHLIKVYPDKIQEEYVLFRTFKKQHIVRQDIPYERLRIFPGRAFFLFEAYSFKDTQLPGVRNVAPDLAVHLMHHIKEVVGEKKWQEICRKE